MVSDLVAPKVATSTADMKGGVGSHVLAVVAPKAGPIDVLPGTPVVVVAKRLWESPTVKKFWQATCLAWGTFWMYVIGRIIIAGGPFALTQAEWIDLLKDGSYPALVTAAAVYGVKLKTADNDPVVNGSITGPRPST